LGSESISPSMEGRKMDSDPQFRKWTLTPITRNYTDPNYRPQFHADRNCARQDWHRAPGPTWSSWWPRRPVLWSADPLRAAKADPRPRSIRHHGIIFWRSTAALASIAPRHGSVGRLHRQKYHSRMRCCDPRRHYNFRWTRGCHRMRYPYAWRSRGCEDAGAP
jgi:hypothetical protein